jgi:hypothetical protein
MLLERCSPLPNKDLPKWSKTSLDYSANSSRQHSHSRWCRTCLQEYWCIASWVVHMYMVDCTLQVRRFRHYMRIVLERVELCSFESRKGMNMVERCRCSYLPWLFLSKFRKLTGWGTHFIKGAWSLAGRCRWWLSS